MSRILFLCSGNTCRSPMAAAVAQRVFGYSHNIHSAGAATDSGLPPAANAIKAMSEIGIDISKHKTVDVADIDQNDFDLIVIFRPSAAESMSFQSTVRVVFFDIQDPYGESLDTYKSTARLIQRLVRELYVEDSLSRLMTGDVTGSHGSGLFNRAAKEFEKEVEGFVTRVLGLAVHPKATLGQLLKRVSDYIASENQPEFKGFSHAINMVNEKWIKIKHRDDPPMPDVIAGLRSVQQGYTVLRELSDRFALMRKGHGG